MCYFLIIYKGLVAVKWKIKYLFFGCLFPLLCQGQAVQSYNESANGVNVILTSGTLNISQIAESAVRIKFYKGAEAEVPELIFTSTEKTSKLKVAESLSKLEVKGKMIIAVVDKLTGKLSFADNSGKIFLSEKDGARKLIPDSLMGEPCFLAEQSFESPKDEYIFGLGQFQDGHYNLKNITRRLTQVNSQISLPFIYSSKGYGLLWHQ
jgi:alpha-D-xyloside xylohydrolase